MFDYKVQHYKVNTGADSTSRGIGHRAIARVKQQATTSSASSVRRCVVGIKHTNSRAGHRPSKVLAHELVSEARVHRHEQQPRRLIIAIDRGRAIGGNILLLRPIEVQFIDYYVVGYGQEERELAVKRPLEE